MSLSLIHSFILWVFLKSWLWANSEAQNSLSWWDNQSETERGRWTWSIWWGCGHHELCDRLRTGDQWRHRKWWGCVGFQDDCPTFVTVNFHWQAACLLSTPPQHTHCPSASSGLCKRNKYALKSLSPGESGLARHENTGN